MTRKQHEIEEFRDDQGRTCRRAKGDYPHVAVLMRIGRKQRWEVLERLAPEHYALLTTLGRNEVNGWLIRMAHSVDIDRQVAAEDAQRAADAYAAKKARRDFLAAEAARQLDMFA